MSKKFLLLILASLICLFSTTACKRISTKNETKNETKKELVLASFTVLADIIENVAKN